MGKAQPLPLSSVSMDDGRRSKRRLAKTWKSRSEPSLVGLRSSSRALNPPVRSSLPNPVEHLSDLAFAAEPYRQVGYDLDVVVPWDALGAEGEGPAWPVSTESRVCNSSFRRASSRLVDKPLTGLSCVHGTSRRVAIAAGEATG